MTAIVSSLTQEIEDLISANKVYTNKGGKEDKYSCGILTTVGRIHV